MLIRKNTKAFKSILEIMTSCQDRPDREKLIRLYITKAGDTVRERISIEGIQGEASLFYEMSYQTVLNSLKSSNHQLHLSDEIPGIYFFHSSSNKVWDESPFEFDESVREVFSSLPELPSVRKKEKAELYVFPAPKVKSESAPAKSKPDEKKQKPDKPKTAKAESREPKQPDYKLPHKVRFSDLDKIVFRQSNLSKRGVLDYYNQVSGSMLPFLKDRFLSIRHPSDATRPAISLTTETLFKAEDDVPEWIHGPRPAKGKSQTQPLLCNDREHLLFYVEMGCVEFNTAHARVKSLDSPDYFVISIDSSESELSKAIEVAHAAKEILTGLQLPSFVKTDGLSGLHIYVPLDSKSEFDVSRDVAGYICKLIRLKLPGMITMAGVEDYVYGKVSLDFSINEADRTIVAPYSLLAGHSAVVAAPLLWEELKDGLRLEDFHHENILSRLKKVGDPFENLIRKKVNGDELLGRLEEHYSFLL